VSCSTRLPSTVSSAAPESPLASGAAASLLTAGASVAVSAVGADGSSAGAGVAEGGLEGSLDMVRPTPSTCTSCVRGEMSDA